MTKSLEGRIALVTGASRGIGRAVARLLASEGAHVIAAARTQGGLEELDDEIRDSGGTATLCPVDLLKGEEIDGLAIGIQQRWGRLDILVGNAAMLGRLAPLGHFPPDEWTKAFALNVHANFRLIRDLDPLLRAAPAGRAVFVTSGAARKHPPYWGLYAATKAALEAMVRCYAAEAANTPLRVNLLSPGPTRTHMRALAMPGEDPATLPAPDLIARSFLPLVAADCRVNGEIVEAKRE